MEEIRVGFLLGINKMKISILKMDDVIKLLEEDKHNSVCVNADYYMFIPKELDVKDPVIISNMIHLSSELEILHNIDKEKRSYELH